MTFQNTDPVTKPYINNRSFYVSSNFGILTVKKRMENGSWVEVSGSPVGDGEELTINTQSYNGRLQFTPSVAGVEWNFQPKD